MIFHIVWATHNSRASSYTDNRVNNNLSNYRINPVVAEVDSQKIELSEQETQIIAAFIKEKAKYYQCTIHALNVLTDHVHMLIECNEQEVSKIIGQIKGYTAREFNKLYRKEDYQNREHRYYDGTIIKLWVRRFSKTVIKTEEQLINTMNYIIYNREKHFSQQGV